MFVKDRGWKDEWLLEVPICAPVRTEHFFISKMLEAQQGLKQQMEEEIFLSSGKKGQQIGPIYKDQLISHSKVP